MVAADFCQVSIPSGYGFRESLVAVERANKDNSPEKRLARESLVAVERANKDNSPEKRLAVASENTPHRPAQTNRNVQSSDLRAKLFFKT
jgi:hypothetical protein